MASALTDRLVHQNMANAVRFLAIDAVEKAQSGHPGMPMGMADVATVLFRDFLSFSPEHPTWPNRDRFVLSAGHGSMLLYALLHLTGYADVSREALQHFRQWNSKTPGHPEHGHTEGVETTTGPLGQGLSNAVGFALSEAIMAAKLGSAFIDHRTYAIVSDGDLMEGISHEAGALAGHLRLRKLIVLWDDNGITIDGSTKLSTSEDVTARFSAYGWYTTEIDGHDPVAIHKAIAAAQKNDAPTLIACKTVIGFGSPNKAGSEHSHGAPLGANEITLTREQLGWPHAPFEVPEAVAADWREVGVRGASRYREWEARFAALSAEIKQEFSRRLEQRLPENLPQVFAEIKRGFIAQKTKLATRAFSGEVIAQLLPHLPELIGGSADLSGSNNTMSKQHGVIRAGDFSGNYLHYGIREHGMGAIMNGMALYGGLIPYGGTFLVFSDYCRPAIRLSALMKQRVIWVMTHDSIGLGEDGPTHQPIEHLAALRAIPNLYVFRPADAVEVAEAWEWALACTHAPSLFALTRQSAPLLRKESAENLSARGAYVLEEAASPLRVTLWATGSEVGIACKAREMLEAKQIGTRVISAPCHRLFLAQPAEYRATLQRKDSRHIAVEAGIAQGWDALLGGEGEFVGLNDFGASAPADVLYRAFGLTPEAIVARVEGK